jgi:death-on-curing protein
MAGEPIWLSRRLLDVMHSQLILEYGGRPGVRDASAIESALARAQNKHAYGETQLPALAAAYAYGLSRNHGYVDGNKRIAAAAIGVFLDLNGLDLNTPEAELVRVMVAVAAGNFNEKALGEWIAEQAQSK